MTPLPPPYTAESKTANETSPALPSALTSSAGPYSTANRRAPTNPVPRAYPWLLFTSTAIAALFCLLYITKPVIVSSAAPTTPAAPAAPAKLTPAIPNNPAPQTALMPSNERLPGELSPAPASGMPTATTPRRPLPGPPSSSTFEETNLRIQHVLTAEAPGNHLDRIDLEVPVLYQSRNLRWTPADITEARKLLIQLADYQEKSQRLRAEGSELLDLWNRLIGRSIPVTDLRADSPSLPANQEDGADAPRPAGLITTESIQIKPAEK
jgi:hypothetical protein